MYILEQTHIWEKLKNSYLEVFCKERAQLSFQKLPDKIKYYKILNTLKYVSEEKSLYLHIEKI